MDGGLALLVRGIRWRRGASLVLLLCAAVTVAGAAAGPTWGEAAQASLLERTLRDAPVSGRGFTTQGTTRPDPNASFGFGAEPRLVGSDVRDAVALPPGLDELFDERTETVRTARRLQVQPVVPPPPETGPDGLPLPPPDAPLGRLVSREGACEQLRLVEGRCPTTTTEVLLSDRSAAELGVSAGQLVRLPELAVEPPPAGSGGFFEIDYVVAGTYAASSVDTGSRFWFDSEDFEYAPPTLLGGELVPARLDAVLVDPDLVVSLRTPGLRIQVERVLRDGVVTLANADRVARGLQEQVVLTDETRGQVQAKAPAALTIESTATGRRLVRDSSTFVGLQVVVLGWVVLFGLVAVTVAARDDELALAKLRGLRGLRLAVHALAEPIGLVLLAVPLGVLLAQVAVRSLAGAVLLPGTPVGLPAPTWGAVGATVAGAAVACALAARRSLRVPVAEQLRRRASEAAPGAAPVAVTAVLATLVAVAVVLLLTLGRSAQAALPALLAPVLIGLVAGLLLAHAVRLLVRVGLGRTRGWSLGPYLAVRQVAGQGALTRTTALVTAATAVSGFAGGAYVLTAAQRDAQAALDVGAERVVHVAPATTKALLDVTRQVDPDGAWAMAVVQRGTGQEALLAVDSSRFGVATPVPGGALAAGAALDDDLVPDDVVDPLVLTGPDLTVRVAGSQLSRADVELALTVRLLGSDGEPAAITMGVLDGQEQTLTAAAPMCVGGCTVLSLVLPRASGTGTITGSLDLVSVAAGGEEVPFLRDEWRVARVDEARLDSSTTGSLTGLGPNQGINLLAVVPASATTGVVRRDVPTELPALLGAATTLRPVGLERLLDGTTLEGGDLPFRPVGRTPAVPRTEQGSLVDLELVSRVQPPRSSGLDFQVWLGTGAPADAPDRLAAAGLEVVEVEARTGRRVELDSAEPARAQLLLLGAGAATLVAGVAGVGTALAAAARRRAAESAALRAMAVPGRTVRGSALLEDAFLLLPGVVLGAVCAAVAVVLCSPVLAEVTGASQVVAGSVPATEALLPVLLVALGTLVLLVPVVLLVTRHGDDETRLRQGT